MDVVYSHVCGLDVHKKNVVACIITPDHKETRTFSTMTDDLLAKWIASLLRHGLLQGSYIPNREQRELRELIRYRRSLIEERVILIFLPENLHLGR
ncbi:hypothetical protein BSNK01_05200 [Bacillaceae bacterium]